MKSLSVFLSYVIGIVSATAFALISFLYPFAKIWNWFMVPFFGLPVMTYSMVVILILLKNLMFMNMEDTREKTEEEKNIRALAMTLYPWFVLLIAYFVHTNWPVVSAL